MNMVYQFTSVCSLPPEMLAIIGNLAVDPPPMRTLTTRRNMVGLEWYLKYKPQYFKCRLDLILQNVLRMDDLEQFLWLVNRGLVLCFHHAIEGTLDRGAFSIAKWIIKNTQTKVPSFVDNAIFSDNLEMIKWLVRQGGTFTRWALHQCVALHNEHILRWFIETRLVDIDQALLNSLLKTAVEQGNLDALIYLYEQGATIPLSTIDFAISLGHLCIAQWLFDNGHDCSIISMKHAIRLNRADLLEWLRKHYEWKIDGYTDYTDYTEIKEEE